MLPVRFYLNNTTSVLLLYNVPQDSAMLNGNTLKQYDKATHLCSDIGKDSNSACIPLPH